MIQVNELRIGNWVNDIVGGFCQIEELPALFGSAFRWGWLTNINPIPLTPEVLESLPLFNSNKQNGYPYRFLDGFLKMRNGVFFFKYYNIEIELPYVHTFQNLHFALTGEELQIDL